MAEEKTFTQEEVESIVAKRVSRAMKDMPSEKDLAEFATWKENRGKDAQTIQTLTTERDSHKAALDAANAELSKMKHEQTLLAKGVPADEIDYYDFKISQMVNDKTTFEQAAEVFIKENAPHSRVKVSIGGSLGGTPSGGKTTNEIMNDLFRNSRK